jgi:hypothetical protein
MHPLSIWDNKVLYKLPLLLNNGATILPQHIQIITHVCLLQIHNRYGKHHITLDVKQVN